MHFFFFLSNIVTHCYIVSHFPDVIWKFILLFIVYLQFLVLFIAFILVFFFFFNKKYFFSAISSELWFLYSYDQGNIKNYSIEFPEIICVNLFIYNSKVGYFLKCMLFFYYNLHTIFKFVFLFCFSYIFSYIMLVII